MPVRHYFLLAILAATATIPAWGQKVQSTWWYPSGNMEGTRRHLYFDSDTNYAFQTEHDLVVKWRVPILYNSPVVLVGGIRRTFGDSVQQVVGLIENTDSLIIISHRGIVEKAIPLKPLAFSPGEDVRLTLTGLFNSSTAATTPEPRGTPNLIGIGVERRQNSDSLFAMALDREGAPKWTFALSLPASPRPDNRSAGIYPVAIYNNGALVAVSQNRFVGNDSTANSLRRYGINPLSTNTKTTPQWSYPIGPKTYPQHPAIAVDPSAPQAGAHHFALATAPYPSANKRQISPPPFPPVQGLPTYTDSAYSVSISDSAGFPVHKGTTHIPPAHWPGSEEPAEVRSYFFTLYESREGRGEIYRLVTSEHDAAHPGRPRMLLKKAFERDTTTYGEFETPQMSESDLGLTIVAADIDGQGEDRSIFPPDGGSFFFRNNYGDEIVAAFRDPEGNDLPTNYIMALRRSDYDVAGGVHNLKEFVRYPFSGRLMAAGNLVNDTAFRETVAKRTHRHELVIADGNRIRILQLRDYNDNVFNNVGSSTKDFFRVVDSFELDARVVSAAIADLEGDGENDLIVTTEQSTYAIGLRVPDALGAIASDSSRYCGQKEIAINWNRRTGGGQNGVRVVLVKPNAMKDTLHDGYIGAARRDSLNPGVGLDTFRIPATGLAPGDYRVILEDPLVGSIIDTSNTFTINQPIISGFRLDTAAGVGFERPILLSARVECSEGLLLRRSISDGEWETLQAPVELTDDSATATTAIACPPDLACGASGSLRVRYQFVDKHGFGASDIASVDIPIELHALELDSSAGRRLPTIRWSPADFTCPSLAVSLSADSGRTWSQPYDVVNTTAAQYQLPIPGEISGKMMLRVCCADGAHTCETGLSQAFEIKPLPIGDAYVIPNPFDPGGRGPYASEVAMIAYTLKSRGSVTVTIFDASRTVVRRLIAGEMRDAGRQEEAWDGRNSRDEIVASGTYICIIESSSNEPYTLPIIVVRH